MNGKRITGEIELEGATVVVGLGGYAMPPEMGADEEGFQGVAVVLYGVAMGMPIDSIKLETTHVFILDTSAALVAAIQRAHERAGQLDAYRARLDQHLADELRWRNDNPETTESERRE